VHAGGLRQRVTIEVRTKVSDGSDGYVESWSALRERVPAQVEDLDGREIERARQIDARATHMVTVRYWADYRDELTPRVRIVYHDGPHRRAFEPVEPIREVELRVKLMVRCREMQGREAT
jgi:SPP1 family predicted phage head-tail adaptor